MQVELFTKPNRSYHALVTELYGRETGDVFNSRYENELTTSLWKGRLHWLGFGVRNDNGCLKAHAIAQFIEDKPLVYVGYVETVPDRTYAQVLARAIAAHLDDRKSIYLPVNLSIWHTYRWKFRGEEALPFEPFGQPYYAELFEGLYSRKETFSSYRFDVPDEIAYSAGPYDFDIRAVSPTHFFADLGLVYDLSRSIFQDSHSIPSFEEFRELYRGSVSALDPRYILIAEERGEPAGFIYAVRRDRSVYIKTFGVLPAFHRRGIGTGLFGTICRHAQEDGCHVIYGLLIKDDRPIVQLLPAGAVRVAEYVVYREN